MSNISKKAIVRKTYETSHLRVFVRMVLALVLCSR